MSPVKMIAPGNLLVATAKLQDPNFRRAVVYVVMRDAEGVLGVVLNRPSDTAIQTAIPSWADFATSPRALYVGGPVQNDSAMAIGVLRPGTDPLHHSALQPVAGRAALVSLESDPAEVSPLLDGVRIYVGHAGWGPEQLQNEIAEGAWHVLPSLDADLVTGARTDLYFRVLRRQPLPLAYLAYHPGDLHRN